MRILSLTAQKPTSTGSGVYLTEVMRALSSFGAEQAIVCGMMPGDTQPEFFKEVKQYKVKFMSDSLPFAICGMSDVMPYVATRYRDLDADMLQSFKCAFTRTIKEAVLDFKPDLIISHHLYLTTAIAASLVRELGLDIKIVGICHGTDLRQMEKHNLEHDFISEEICSLDKIFALHDAQIEDIIRIYGAKRDKIDVLGSGYNGDLFCSDNKNDRDASSILFVGKVSIAKGVESLLRAFENLKATQTHASLTLVGGHSDQREYSDIVRLANDLKIEAEFKGVVSFEDLVKCYRKSHTFVLPSFFEGLPLVSLEACACGCVCVMTALPGVREWYTKNAPDAPIIFIDPPLMETIDIPKEESLPNFEDRLTSALRRANKMCGNPSSVEHLSWKQLTKRLLEFV